MNVVPAWSALIGWPTAESCLPFLDLHIAVAPRARRCAGSPHELLDLGLPHSVPAAQLDSDAQSGV
jgi:hypothetical protein